MKLLTKVVQSVLAVFFIKSIDSNQFISIFVQKCYGTCNNKYCNVSISCRPLNRTSKWTSMDFYFRQGLKLEAPINVIRAAGNVRFVNCQQADCTIEFIETLIQFKIEVIAYKKFRAVYRQHMLKLKTELCAQFNTMDHPFFGFVLRFWKLEVKGNMLDPCPLSGHRYVKPYVSTHDHIPLVPVGEWKVDFIISKIINNSDEFITSWSNFYEVKPTSAVEF